MNTALSQYEKTKEKDLTALSVLLLGLEELKQKGKRIKGITKEEWKEIVNDKAVLSEEDVKIPQGLKRTRFKYLIERLIDGEKLEDVGLVKKKITSAGTILGLTENGWSLIATEYAIPSQPSPVPINIPHMPKLNVSETAPVVKENMVANFALLLIAQYNHTHKKPMTTETLKKVLLKDTIIHPESAEQLANRKDAKITQIIRNLKSHNRLKKMGWVSQTDDGYNVLKSGLVEVGKNFSSSLLGAIAESEMRFSKANTVDECKIKTEAELEKDKPKKTSNKMKP